MQQLIGNAYTFTNNNATIRNDVDTQEWSPIDDPSIAQSFGFNGRYAIFVGRITRQKGLAHLLRAWSQVPDEYGIVLCAGSADEAGIGAEFEELDSQLQKTRKNIWWIKEMLPKSQLIPQLQLLSIAASSSSAAST
jgi:starch synthase